MVAIILSWIGSVVAAISGTLLLRGSPNTKIARYLSALGMILPLVGALATGTSSKVFALILPIGLMMTAGGALLYSNIEQEDTYSKRIYTAVIVAIVGFSIAGWAIVLERR